MKYSIAILMSTYNGQEYLSEQINSILNQSNKDWILYIRDDGSTDNTVKIINDYQTRYAQIKVIKDSIAHRGCAQSFLYLLTIIDADFYMFCDQDDIWLKDKIDICFKKYKEEKYYSLPILIHTDVRIVDKNLTSIYPSLWSYNGSSKWIGTKMVLPVYNYITGCTMFFNRKARDLCLEHTENVVMHDAYVALCVLFNKGVIIDISEATLLYRQHESNVLGAFQIIPKIRKLANIWQVIRNNYKQYKMLTSITNYNLVQFLRLKWLILRN